MLKREIIHKKLQRKNNKLNSFKNLTSDISAQFLL